MITKPLLQAFKDLPKIALDNIVQPDNLPKEATHLSGHPVTLTPADQQYLALSRKRQIIQDWQAAAADVKKMFDGIPELKNPIVIPQAVFDDVCRCCRLIRFEDIGNEGKVFVNPLQIDAVMISGKGNVLSPHIRLFHSWSNGNDYVPKSFKIEDHWPFRYDPVESVSHNGDISCFINEDIVFNDSLFSPGSARVGFAVRKKDLLNTW